MGDGVGNTVVNSVVDVHDAAVRASPAVGASLRTGGAAPSGPARFAMTARRLGDEVRRMGLQVPAFRSPPRMLGADRTIHRRAGHVTVAVRSRDRPWPAVVADLIEGVVVANDLSPPASGRARAALWAALVDSDALAA